jgi:hypothetical protein
MICPVQKITIKTYFEMKRLFTMIGVGMMILLCSCNNQKYKSLESENKQLIQRIDSLNIIVKVQCELANKNAKEAKIQKTIADSALTVAKEYRILADSAAAEAKSQAELAWLNKKEALRQTMLSTEKRNQMEELRQTMLSTEKRKQADSIANQPKVKK